MSTQAAEAAPVVEQNEYVTVPETKLPGGHVEPAFLVAKYFGSLDADGKLQSVRSAKPLTDISHYDALDLCAASGVSMITETQALALAWNLSQVGANWTSGVVGEGSMYQGLHLDLYDVDEPYAGDFVSRDPLDRREFVLSNGETIIDGAGNLFCHIFDNVQGNERGVCARAFADDSPSITTAPYPSMQKGMGWQPAARSNWSGYALIRGGCWCSSSGAGVFDLNLGSPDGSYGNVGVRCTI